MTTESLNSSQDYILSCRIVSAIGEPFELKTFIIELNIFEDIFNNVTSGNMLISDSQNLINALSLSGNEIIILTLSKPGISEWRFSKTFRLYRIGERKIASDTFESYILYFVSEEFLLSEGYRVSKSYKNCKISDIVKDISLRYLGIPEDNLVIQDSIGLRNIIVPNYKIFEALNWLSTFAISDKKTDSSFVYFQNLNGFNFRSLLTLESQKVKWEYSYSVKNVDETLSDKNLFTVIGYEMLTAFNSAKLAHEGALTNKLITIDPLRMKFSETVFDYSKYNSSDSKGFATNNKDRFGNYALSKSLNGALKMNFTNFGQQQAEYVKEKNISINVNNAEVNIPNRTAQLSLIGAIRLKIAVPGNPVLSVGDKLKFNLPSMAKVNNSENRGLDEYYSGEYLITAVRHMVSQEQKYVSILEISKSSPENNYPSFDVKSPAYINSRKYS